MHAVCWAWNVRRKCRPKAWNIIEDMLKNVVIAGNGEVPDCTIRDAIKIIADESIGHYDNVHREKSHSWEVIQILKELLLDKTAKANIDYIIEVTTNAIQSVLEVE